MKEQHIQTSIGEIALQIKEIEGTIPIIFLHGVYFDHNLWNYQTARISDRTVITLDMPLHGNSKNITKENWSIDDCSIMLMEILNKLNIHKVIAVGHSWGSMTILRAASNYPERFQSIGLCNMPFEAATKKTKWLFKLQHMALAFRKFYTRQAAKSLFGKQTFLENPSLMEYLELSMNKLSIKEIKQTDKAAIIEAVNTESLFPGVMDFSLALKGKEDYVPAPGQIKTILVEGGHVSPLEVPEEVGRFIQQVIEKN